MSNCHFIKQTLISENQSWSWYILDWQRHRNLKYIAVPKTEK